MTTQINYTTSGGKCTATASIKVLSALLDAYTAALPSPDHTLQLIVTVGCDTSYEIDLDEDNIVVDGGGDYYLVIPSDLSTTETLSNGIYHLELKKTVTATGSTSSEYYCLFVDCGVACQIMDYIALDLDSPIVGYYQLLLKLNTCGDCNCDGACIIYSKIQELLDNSSELTNGCGCN